MGHLRLLASPLGFSYAPRGFPTVLQALMALRVLVGE